MKYQTKVFIEFLGLCFVVGLILAVFFSFALNYPQYKKDIKTGIEHCIKNKGCFNDQR